MANNPKYLASRKLSCPSRITALFVLALFTLTNFSDCSGSLFAQSLPDSVLPGHGNHIADLREIADSLALPEELGTIHEKFLPRGKLERLVIYIQDAHANYDAESNSSKLIQFLERKYNLELVVLEGGEGKLDNLFFKSFPNPKEKEKVLDEYLRNGELQGGEVASILSEGNSVYYGAEKQVLYDANKRAFLKATAAKNQVTKFLTQEKSRLDLKANVILNSNSKKFLNSFDGFRKEKINLLEYLKILASFREARQSLNRYPELRKVLFAAKREKQFNNRSSNIQVKQVIRTFESKIIPHLPKSEQLKAGEKIQLYQTQSLDAGSLLSSLQEFSKKVNYSFVVPPRLKVLICHTNLLSSIKGTKLFDELEVLENDLRNRLAQSDQERELLKEYKFLSFLESLASLELTHKEWMMSRTYSLNPNYLRLFSNHIQFYALALERDTVLFQNTIKFMEKENQRIAVLTTGGFHQEGITGKLHEAGIPYISVTPRIQKPENRETYFRVMRDERSFMKYFRGDLWDALAQDYAFKLKSALYERERCPSLKRWRDQIIQNLVAEGRIEQAGSYTKYIDALSQGEDRIKLEKELNSFFDIYFERLSNDLNKKLDAFASQFKKTRQDSFKMGVQDLANRMNSLSHSNLAAPLALTHSSHLEISSNFLAAKARSEARTETESQVSFQIQERDYIKFSGIARQLSESTSDLASVAYLRAIADALERMSRGERKEAKIWAINDEAGRVAGFQLMEKLPQTLPSPSYFPEPVREMLRMNERISTGVVAVSKPGRGYGRALLEGAFRDVQNKNEERFHLSEIKARNEISLRALHHTMQDLKLPMWGPIPSFYDGRFFYLIDLHPDLPYSKKISSILKTLPVLSNNINRVIERIKQEQAGRSEIRQEEPGTKVNGNDEKEAQKKHFTKIIIQLWNNLSEQLLSKYPRLRLTLYLMRASKPSVRQMFGLLAMSALFVSTAPAIEFAKGPVILAVSAFGLWMGSSYALFVPLVDIIVFYWLGGIIRTVPLLVFGAVFRLPVFWKAFYANWVPFVGAFAVPFATAWDIFLRNNSKYESLRFKSLLELNEKIQLSVSEQYSNFSVEERKQLERLSPQIIFLILDFQLAHQDEWMGRFAKVRGGNIESKYLQSKIDRNQPTIFLDRREYIEGIRSALASSGLRKIPFYYFNAKKFLHYVNQNRAIDPAEMIYRLDIGKGISAEDMSCLIDKEAEEKLSHEFNQDRPLARLTLFGNDQTWRQSFERDSYELDSLSDDALVLVAIRRVVKSGKRVDRRLMVVRKKDISDSIDFLWSGTILPKDYGRFLYLLDLRIEGRTKVSGNRGVVYVNNIVADPALQAEDHYFSDSVRNHFTNLLMAKYSGRVLASVALKQNSFWDQGFKNWLFTSFAHPKIANRPNDPVVNEVGHLEVQDETIDYREPLKHPDQLELLYATIPSQTSQESRSEIRSVIGTSNQSQDAVHSKIRPYVKDLFNHVSFRLAAMVFIIGWGTKLAAFLLLKEPERVKQWPTWLTRDFLHEFEVYRHLLFGTYSFKLNYHDPDFIPRILNIASVVAIPFIFYLLYRVNQGRFIFKERLGKIGTGILVGALMGNGLEVALKGAAINWLHVSYRSSNIIYGQTMNFEDLVLILAPPILLGAFAIKKLFFRTKKTSELESASFKSADKSSSRSEARQESIQILQRIKDVLERKVLAKELDYSHYALITKMWSIDNVIADDAEEVLKQGIMSQEIFRQIVEEAIWERFGDGFPQNLTDWLSDTLWKEVVEPITNSQGHKRSEVRVTVERINEVREFIRKSLNEDKSDLKRQILGLIKGAAIAFGRDDFQLTFSKLNDAHRLFGNNLGGVQEEVMHAEDLLQKLTDDLDAEWIHNPPHPFGSITKLITDIKSIVRLNRTLFSDQSFGQIQELLDAAENYSRDKSVIGIHLNAMQIKKQLFWTSRQLKGILSSQGALTSLPKLNDLMRELLDETKIDIHPSMEATIDVIRHARVEEEIKNDHPSQGEETRSEARVISEEIKDLANKMVEILPDNYESKSNVLELVEEAGYLSEDRNTLFDALELLKNAYRSLQDHLLNSKEIESEMERVIKKLDQLVEAASVSKFDGVLRSMSDLDSLVGFRKEFFPREEFEKLHQLMSVVIFAARGQTAEPEQTPWQIIAHAFKQIEGIISKSRLANVEGFKNVISDLRGEIKKNTARSEARNAADQLEQSVNRHALHRLAQKKEHVKQGLPVLAQELILVSPDQRLRRVNHFLAHQHAPKLNDAERKIFNSTVGSIQITKPTEVSVQSFDVDMDIPAVSSIRVNQAKDFVNQIESMNKPRVEEWRLRDEWFQDNYLGQLKDLMETAIALAVVSRGNFFARLTVKTQAQARMLERLRNEAVGRDGMKLYEKNRNIAIRVEGKTRADLFPDQLDLLITDSPKLFSVTSQLDSAEYQNENGTIRFDKRVTLSRFFIGSAFIGTRQQDGFVTTQNNVSRFNNETAFLGFIGYLFETMLLRHSSDIFEARSA